MSKLVDEPFEKAVDDKIEAWDMNEAIEGIVQCNNCNFWGKMEGTIEARDKKNILFVCPTCKAVERVRNPEWMQ